MILEGKTTEEIIIGLLKNWEVESLDAVGHSGGLITAQSPALKKIESRNLDYVIETKLQDQEIGIIFTFLNIYGPFYDKKVLWEKLSLEGALNQPNIIVGEELNLTISGGEYWGENTR